MRGIDSPIPNKASILEKTFGNITEKEYMGHKRKVYSVDWNCIGTKLGSGSADSTIRIWNLEQSGLSKGFELKGHTDMVDPIAWHPSHEQILASASVDKTLKIWDCRSPKAPAKSEKTKGANINLAWNSDGSLVAVGNKDDVISFYDFKTFKLIKNMPFKLEVNEFRWDNNSNMLFITTTAGPIYVMNGKKLQNTPLTQLEAHTGPCFCIVLDPLNKYMATGAADALICLWDLSELACIQTFIELDLQVRQLSFSHDGKYIASASEDKLIGIFDIHAHSMVHSVPCKAPQHTVSWHPAKYVLAYAGEEKKGTTDDGSIHLIKFA